MRRVVPAVNDLAISPPRFRDYKGQPEFVYKDILYEFKYNLGRGDFGDVNLFGVASTDPTPLASIAYPFVVVKSELPFMAGGYAQYREGVNFEMEAKWNRALYGLGGLSGHPNANVRHYVLMKYIPGKSLDSYLTERCASFDVRTMLHWFIAIALSFKQIMHEKLAVHSDVKPSNILIDLAAQGGIQSNPIDFGLTASEGEPIGRYKGSAKNFPQTAPELFGAHRIAARKNQDSYGLGCVLTLMASSLLLSDTPQAEKESVNDVIRELRHLRPENRFTVDQAVAEIHASFFSPVVRILQQPLTSPPATAGHVQQGDQQPLAPVSPPCNYGKAVSKPLTPPPATTRQPAQQGDNQPLPPVRPPCEYSKATLRAYRVWAEEQKRQRAEEAAAVQEYRALHDQQLQGAKPRRL